ncbi:CmpA/NrtA family ABC transporter substrate-binding protein [Gloeocapsopsis dulcis]|uniref:Bicarbonate-binding protein n=1 Tax=Gloeocapsopsis dulcis AAB1 = 1H9 TaxID=1433147 RepID=A0A6N8G4H6_9CHRO|nr:CmpA/NrtA family ABC transporter substrate-binding protein [Gloeocapsopsis dulcis]MUL39235.1 bicarbonate-binding protein [Gloeocapsopsis dulcis AAB1 = 1H9]WNN88048.1 CmpA/NrtA family ABC transporter substrate-binding protein [Gloeocapsopsis dulcis]
MTKFTRRQFIFTAGTAAAASALMHGCANGNSNTAANSAGTVPAANIDPADAPEVTTARLGFIALTDAAPLIVAKEKGYFDRYGMTDVEVAKQASWAVTRDNLVLGSGGGGIDGAHILTPMPYLMSLGTITQGNRVPMYILARLNTNGQGICLSNTYKELNVGLDSSPLQQAFAQQKSAGRELKAAVTFPGGTHDLWMRYWLAAGGINPNSDISLIVVPPPQMVQNVRVGNMETFCVGEPWPAQTVTQGIGYTALTTGELWKDHPEKALAMRADWVDQHPKATRAILMAVQEAQQWCALPENKEEMANIVSNRQWFGVPVKDILGRFQGQYDYGTGRVEDYSDSLLMKFWRDNASYPYKSHDLWFLTENIRWGYIPGDTDTRALVDQVNREDLWREAAQAIGVPAAEIPQSTSRGVETFFDGVQFDPENPTAYLNSLKIKQA